MKKDATVTVTIDNKPYTVPGGISILEAAEQNGIYIPTLCAHEELTPYGGCRMCIVEVEGMRNLPTACTTPIADGMVIRTNTAQVQSMRTEILQLFLSEHTSSCLICEEKDQCREYMGTIRKAGVTTGCRYCSNDGQCELQDVVEKMEIKDIKYPIYYRNLRVEKEDPFYDRDYNLCVLCGRCVRMCQEVRVAHVLAFNHRGRETVIGPAYERTHLEAGCEFCGACVSVCPTGSLTEKARAYEGKPDREEITTCTFCGVGCQMRLLVKGDRIIGSLPEQDDKVNNGQLCVKGRFCITELVSGPKRAKHPFRTYAGTPAEITWEQAIDAAAEKLAACKPDEFAMLVSPNCTNEDLYVAQKFTRTVMRSHNVDTSARAFYGPGFNEYLNLMKRSVPLSEIRKASAVLCIGLDIRFGRSVVGVELRRAFRKGAKIVSVNPRQHSLAMISERWVQPVPGTEIDFLKSLVKSTGEKTTAAGTKKDDDVAAVARILSESKSTVILLGSEFLQYDASPDILAAVDQLAKNIRAGVMPLPAQNNLYGSLIMGSYPELLPGGQSSTNPARLAQLKRAWKSSIPSFHSKWNAANPTAGKKLKVLYLIGESLLSNADKPADYIISQNIYPTDSLFETDLMLPAAAFTEADGTFINGEGRLQRIRKAVEPPGKAMPDWMILSKIAQKLGIDGFAYKKAADIHKEIAGLVEDFGSFSKPKREARSLNVKTEMKVIKPKRAPGVKTGKGHPFVLSTSISEHTHRGFPLSSWVDGTRSLFCEGRVAVNPEDARKAKLTDGDEVVISSNGFKKTVPVRIRLEQPPGTLQLTKTEAEAVNPNPHPVKMRKK
ncbi:MAG: molybdopterin-dependent oxidoreductase [Candidatus Zixiibacteriota bacterium]|nr:MAG: molybdopterin-dependent oxidoreductase [candidate division Zixibacteria bacterium]